MFYWADNDTCVQTQQSVIATIYNLNNSIFPRKMIDFGGCLVVAPTCMRDMLSCSAASTDGETSSMGERMRSPGLPWPPAGPADPRVWQPELFPQPTPDLCWENVLVYYFIILYYLLIKTLNRTCRKGKLFRKIYYLSY